MGDGQLAKVQSKYLGLLLRGKPMIYYEEALTISTSPHRLVERKLLLHPQHSHLSQ